jgi:hypothetical protein
MRPGTRVEVRSSFDGRWIDGFEVVDGDADEGYSVRRLFDGEVLPARFAKDSIRRERSRQTWWV